MLEMIQLTEKSMSTAQTAKSFPGGSDGKESACNAGDRGSIPGVRKFLWRRKWQSTPVFLPGKSHGGRSLTGLAVYSPWGHKESYTTQRLTLSLSWSQIVNQVVHEYKRKVLEGNEKCCTSEHTNDKKMKQPYCWYGESLSGPDRRSNQPPHSLKPKPDPEQDPNSLQFWEG